MPIQFHSLKVATIRYETASAVQIGFQIPKTKKAIFRFEAGQYLTISLSINGQKIRRAYSICSAIHEPIISILVKRVEQGLVSNYLNDHVKIGDTFDVLPPNGHFKLTLAEKEKHQYYFFGAGSGITPLIAMITSILANEPLSHCHLLYGNRDEDNIIFQKKLNRLRLVYKNRFNLKYILSRPKKEKPKGWKSFMQSSTIRWQGAIGRVEKNSIAAFFSEINTKKPKVDGYFICVPSLMIESTYDSLIDLKFEKKLIHREYFSAPINDASEVTTAETDREFIKSKVTVILEGQQIDFTINDDTNIVQALLDKNIEPPYSCLSGTCSTCMAKLEKGEVVMDVSIGLEDDEKENRFILTCQSHPLTEKITVNYDIL